MNYRHIYHAGNFADVVKHTILLLLLQKLKVKEKPFAVLDAFAGIGLYDLSSQEAQKTMESRNGVGCLFPSGETKCGPDDLLAPKAFGSSPKGTMPAIITQYLRIIGLEAGSYPGSPMLIASSLRDQDHLIAAELHPVDYATLKRNMSYIPNVHVHHIDAYRAIKAFCPPKEKRGLVLLDPAFEVRDEFEKVLDAVRMVKKRFAGGMLMLWYPIKDRKLVDNFYKNYKEIGYTQTTTIEFEIKASEGMNKCGIMISNPPYIEEELQELMEYLAQVMHGRYKLVAPGLDPRVS
jgi:23S rRNA (adenine2030-N6)-methyltransferase